MNSLEITWTTLKTFVNNYALPIQWLDIGTYYYLKAYQDKFEVFCYLPKDGGTDQIDFETNYKAAGNQPVKSQIVQVLGKDTLVLNPFGAMILPVANTTTACDIEIPFTTVMRGGVLFSTNAVMGDYLSMSIIDKNNVTGQGGTPQNPTILGTYVHSWYIMPNVPNKVVDMSISQSLLQGLFIRVNYTSTGSVAPQVVLNFIAYQNSTP